jgi:hypothetical protein
VHALRRAYFFGWENISKADDAHGISIGKPRGEHQLAAHPVDVAGQGGQEHVGALLESRNAVLRHAELFRHALLSQAAGSTQIAQGLLFGHEFGQSSLYTRTALAAQVSERRRFNVFIVWAAHVVITPFHGYPFERIKPKACLPTMYLELDQRDLGQPWRRGL